jgi:DNA uptake protein ComE-like DNA-binding protein
MKTRSNARSLFYFTRSERNGIALFATLCLLIFWLPTWFAHWKKPSGTDFSAYQREIAVFKDRRAAFSLSPSAVADTIDPNVATEDELVAIGLPLRTARTIIKYRGKGGRFRYKEDLQKMYTIDEDLYEAVSPYIALPASSGNQPSPVRLVARYAPEQPAPFDPNTATREELLRLGIPDKVVRTLLNYRSKGGQFHRQEDLQRIYGLTDELYEQLAPYVRLKTDDGSETTESFRDAETPPALDINQATSEDWRRLPGIGPVLSARIVKFRDKLGGFSSVEQVAETYGLPDSTFQQIEGRLVASPLAPSLKINQVSVEELQSHPYLNWRQARAIINYRIQNGPFANLADFSNVQALTEEQRTKLSPYLSFD